jgi:hypothetical protein
MRRFDEILRIVALLRSYGTILGDEEKIEGTRARVKFGDDTLACVSDLFCASSVVNRAVVVISPSPRMVRLIRLSRRSHLEVKVPGHFVMGAVHAFAAALQPGPFQAYLISENLTHGWRRTILASSAASTAAVSNVLSRRRAL